MARRQLAHEVKSQRLSRLNRKETTMIPGILQVKKKKWGSAWVFVAYKEEKEKKSRILVLVLPKNDSG